MDIVEFQPFPKIPRLAREMVITEKIDGTNANVFITPEGDIFPGSRNRWLTLAEDNHGFARWCEGNKKELLQLGPGRHYGEWWGLGINRNYGMREKVFSLFNVARWSVPGSQPACCQLVPVLLKWPVFDTEEIYRTLNALKMHGSFATPGFMNPEGIVIYHKASNTLFKKTFEGDTHGKDAQ